MTPPERRQSTKTAPAVRALAETIRRDQPTSKTELIKALMARPDHIESVLRAGAEKARAIATPLMLELRRAVGLRDLREQAGGKKAAKAKAALPVFKQYREKDGRFHFKLVDAFGRELLASEGFASPREAGELVASLKKSDAANKMSVAYRFIHLDGVLVGSMSSDVTIEDVLSALGAFHEEGA